jgi:IS30 family transposase
MLYRWRMELRKGNIPGKDKVDNVVTIKGNRRIKQLEANLKEEVGHWEGDTVYGQDGYLVTLTERVSKILLTVRVKNKTKKLVTRVINKMLKLYNSICKKITFDNGEEFTGHESIARALNCKVYFAKPYHSWLRGLNENTNGLLRRFF